MRYQFTCKATLLIVSAVRARVVSGYTVELLRAASPDPVSQFDKRAELAQAALFWLQPTFLRPRPGRAADHPTFNSKLSVVSLSSKTQRGFELQPPSILHHLCLP
ncbi:hypothetical protein CgunFtcFv8_022094 [Champsocephalus gunnari]|uniref:Secreted protein n=1 Tax=Champsocephalus gunnari TaxID=52237 RepID=A0AAN8DP10_CHAGU|nr:hypothetical protein CgunFtcFv8_022094 [Champsocephalus gunnari]